MFGNLKFKVVGRASVFLLVVAMLVATMFVGPLVGGGAFATGVDSPVKPANDVVDSPVKPANDGLDSPVKPANDVVALANAAAPQIVKQPAATQTYALAPAKARIYVTAQSDGGYLTYQWYRSKKFDIDGSDLPAVGGDGQPTNPTLITGTGVTTIPAPAGTKATLEVTTPSEAGYYYYWAEITNNVDGFDPTTIRTIFSLARIVDRTLAPMLMNGDFEDHTDTWPLNNTTDTSTGVNSCQFVPALYPVGPASDYFVPYWDTTHYLDNSANLWRYGKNIQFMGANYGATIESSAFRTPGNHYVELTPSNASTIFQEIATVPGKIYEWSYDQAGRASGDSAAGNQLIAIVIGKAINSPADYVGVTNRTQPDYTCNFPALNVDNVNIPEYAGSKTWSYPYGRNTVSYFTDIFNSLGKTVNQCLALADSGTPAITTYNGSKYYIAFSNCPAVHADVHNSGVYTVPEGQGTSIFGFVAIDVNSGMGGAMDNVEFASGTDSDIDKDISFSGDTKISTTTEAGFAYALAEVRGSSVINLSGLTASYTPAVADVPSSGVTAGLGDSDWYAGYTAYDMSAGSGTGTGFATGGKITFTGLTPGKTYRIIGIPIGAISRGLSTNLTPADVLDDEYYSDVALSAATDAGDGISPVEVSYYDGGTKAQIEVLNSNSGVQYALLRETSGSPNTSSPLATWTTGGGEMIFNNLTPGQNYYLVARPLGYSEITYANATPYKVVIALFTGYEGKDLLAEQVSRAAGGTQIDISGSLAGYTYAVYEPTGANAGNIIGSPAVVTVDGQAVSFSGLTADKIYQVVQKYTATGSYLKGVRVYPYPSHLDGDNELEVDYAAKTVTSDSGGVISGDLEYGITHTLGDAAPAGYTRASGTSTISLASEIGSDGKVIYRVALIDGYSGAAVQPTESFTYAAAPDAPTRGPDAASDGTDYWIDYDTETVKIKTGTAADYDWYDESGHSPLTGTDLYTATTTVDFDDLGWSGTEVIFNLRKKATTSSFASEFAAVADTTIAGRPAAPAMTIALSSGTLTISWETAGNTDTYQYQVLNAGSWTEEAGSVGSIVINPYTAGTEYLIRIKATDTAPASYRAHIKSPLFVAPIKIGSHVYGDGISAQSVDISNITDAALYISGATLTGADASSFNLSLTSESDNNKVNATDTNSSWKISPNGTLNARPAPYTATVDVEYFEDGTASGTTAHTSTTVELLITKANWDISALAGLAPTAVTATSADYSFGVVGDGNTADSAELSWSTGGSYTGDGSPGLTSKNFTLSPASTYNISVKALDDGNHFESAPVSLQTIYTPYATPTPVGDFIYVDFATETLKFVNGVNPNLYTVKVGSGAGTTIANGDSVTTLANAGSFDLVISRNSSGNYPASAYSAALTTIGKAGAPSPTTTKASNNTAGDGSIVLAGSFQYRGHSDTDETSNWLPANGSVNVPAGNYDVRLPNTAGAFGSNIAPVTVLVKGNQTELEVAAPSPSLVYGDTGKVIGLTPGKEGTGGGALTYVITQGNGTVATIVPGTGALTILAAGTIKVQVTRAGTADYNAITSAERQIVIAMADQPTALTITSSSPVTFGANGNSYAITSSGGDAGATTYAVIAGGTGAGTISGSTLSITQAGTINLQATRAGDGNYNSVTSSTFILTVDKATPSYAVPTNLTAVYGSTLSSVNPNSGNGTGAGTFAWVEASSTAVGDVGARTHNVSFTPTDTTNYNTVSSVSASINVTAASDTIAIAQPSPALKYGDSNRQLLLATQGNGTGSLTYNKTGGTSTSTVSASGDISVGTAGTLIVTVTRAAAGNYQAATSDPITINIGKRNINQADVSLTLTGGPWTYTGGQIQPTYNAATDSGAGITTGDYDVSYGANINAGTNAGSVILTGKGNYEGTKTVTFNIGKTAPLTAVAFPTANAVDYSASGTLAGVALGGGTGDGTFVWAAPSTKPTVGNSGYAVRFTPSDAVNYDYSSYSGETGYNAATGAFTRIVTLTVNQVEDPAYSVPSGLTAVAGATLDRVSLPAGWAWDEPGTTPVGGQAGDTQQHDATFTPSDTVNYITHTSVTFPVVVTAGADKAKLQAAYNAILKGPMGGPANDPNLPGLHEKNYADVTAFLAAFAEADRLINDIYATQKEVDAAVSALNKAMSSLTRDHHVLKNSHDAGKGGQDGLTAFGQSIRIEIKGDFRDVAGFKVNNTAYALSAYVNETKPRIITEAGSGQIGMISNGSAIVTLTSEFADRLENGDHDVTVIFRDPYSADANGRAAIHVARAGSGADPGAGEPISPRTGDAMNLMLWLALAAAAMIALLAAAAGRLRKPRKSRRPV
ncbi:MAG: hypothetical protein LBN12_01600 [Clostridiales Family XIII bacterium]|jgi:hypothetical protein|nr:hypothetical protein [Clostridiales Family XIII bacterium]